MISSRRRPPSDGSQASGVGTAGRVVAAVGARSNASGVTRPLPGLPWLVAVTSTRPSGERAAPAEASTGSNGRGRPVRPSYRDASSGSDCRTRPSPGGRAGRTTTSRPPSAEKDAGGVRSCTPRRTRSDAAPRSAITPPAAVSISVNRRPSTTARRPSADTAATAVAGSGQGNSRIVRPVTASTARTVDTGTVRLASTWTTSSVRLSRKPTACPARAESVSVSSRPVAASHRLPRPPSVSSHLPSGENAIGRPPIVPSRASPSRRTAFIGNGSSPGPAAGGAAPAAAAVRAATIIAAMRVGFPCGMAR